MFEPVKRTADRGLGLNTWDYISKTAPTWQHTRAWQGVWMGNFNNILPMLHIERMHDRLAFWAFAYPFRGLFVSDE